MTKNEVKDLTLDEGFTEVPLDEGFEEVPLDSTSLHSNLYNKAVDLGKEAIETGKSALKSGVETLADTGRGLTQGISAGTSDEAIAALKASLPDTSGQDWKQLFRKYQEEEQAKNLAASERSPIAYGAGEIGGLIAPALVTGGASVPAQAAGLTARTVAKKALTAGATGALQGALYGAAASQEGKIIGATPQEEQKMIGDVESGALTGGVFGAGLGAATKVVPAAYKAGKEKIQRSLSNFIEDSPFFRQVVKAKELGDQGVKLFSSESKYGPIGEKTGLIHQDTNATRDLVDRIYKVDEKLGQGVGEAIDNATNQGVTVDLSEPMLKSVNTFKTLLNNDETLRANPKAQKLYDTIFQMGDFDAGNLTPKEVQSLRNQVLDFSDSIKMKNPDIAHLGYEFQGQIGNLLKETVPEYKIASQRFESFRRLVPETIISGATPVDISQVKLGNIKNDEAKLFGSVKSMIQGAEVPGSGSKEASETYKNFINGIKQFDDEEMVRAKAGLIDPTDMPKMLDTTDQSQAEGMAKLIKDKADSSALLKQAWRVTPHENMGTSIKGASFGPSAAMNIANKYGLYKDTLKKPIAVPTEIGKKMYSASEEQLRGMATKMSQIPGLASVGKSLIQGLDNKDVTGVNAAIFSILQNPQARISVNDEEDIKPYKKEE